MAAKEIIWSLRAKKELKEVLEFFTERNGNSNYSLKLLSEIQRLTKTLAKSELIGRLTSNKSTRVLPFKSYLIFYEIDQKRIKVLSFWDNRQDSKKSIQR